MLSMVLDDNRTYQEATKSVLIGKREDVFKEFKSKVETEDFYETRVRIDKE